MSQKESNLPMRVGSLPMAPHQAAHCFDKAVVLCCCHHVQFQTVASREGVSNGQPGDCNAPARRSSFSQERPHAVGYSWWLAAADLASASACEWAGLGGGRGTRESRASKRRERNLGNAARLLICSQHSKSRPTEEAAGSTTLVQASAHTHTLTHIV